MKRLNLFVILSLVSILSLNLHAKKVCEGQGARSVKMCRYACNRYSVDGGNGYCLCKNKLGKVVKEIDYDDACDTYCEQFTPKYEGQDECYGVHLGGWASHCNCHAR